MRSSTMPNVIRGDQGLPAGDYGASSYQKLHNAQVQALKAYEDKGDLRPALDVNMSSIEITPANTVKTGYYNPDAKANLLGYSDAYIKANDRNGDGALSHNDVYEHLEQIGDTKESIEWLDFLLRHPELDDAKRKQIQESKTEILQSLDDVAASTIDFLDLPDKQGKTDGYVTKDEAAAYFHTQDGVLEAFKKNRQAVRQEFEDTMPQSSFRWFEMKMLAGVALAQTYSKFRHKQPAFLQDGQMSGPERTFAKLWAMMLPESFKSAMIRNYEQLRLEAHKPSL